MVKICVVSPEGLKDDKKVEGLPVPEVLTEIPLQEKLTINDLATIKNPKRRCKGVVIILVMLTLAVTCLCLASVIYSYTNNEEEQDMIKNQEPQRFEIDVTFRDPDDPEKHELEVNIQIDFSNDILTTQHGMAKNPIEITKPVTKTTKQYLYMESAEPAEHITTSQSEMTDESEITKQSVSATDDPGTVSQSATVTTSKNPTTLPQTPAKFTSQESEMSSTTEKTTTPVTTMDEQTTGNTPFRSVSEGYTTMYEQTTGNTPFRSFSEEKTTQYQSTANPLHHLKEEIIVNVGNNTEVFTIPPGEDHEALIFLHDFTHEYTAYLLVEQDLCFVKNIRPFMMSPLGLLNILLNPMYFVHEFIVTQTSYIAIPPPLQRLSFGPEIENLCGNSPTFWLEEMDDDEYDTVNVDDLPWMDWGYPDRYIRRKRSADSNEIKNIRFFDADERMHKEKISFGKLAKNK